MTVLLAIAAMVLQPPAPGQSSAAGAERPAYRALQPGERRDEGLLRRIACPGRGPVIFFVNAKDTKEAKETKAPAKVTQYTAPYLGAVDFIVYRKDFQGPVTCEGFGAGEPVYVTWKEDGQAKRVIAVEFLPK